MDSQHNNVTGAELRILNIVVTETATTIRDLVNTALAVLDSSFTLPEGRTAVAVYLTPVADILAQDTTWGATITLPADTQQPLSAVDVLGQIKLSCVSGTVAVPAMLHFI